MRFAGPLHQLDFLRIVGPLGRGLFTCYPMTTPRRPAGSLSRGHPSLQKRRSAETLADHAEIDPSVVQGLSAVVLTDPGRYPKLMRYSSLVP